MTKDANLKYLQVYNQLKKDLYSGKYPVGSLLPTETQLAEQFSASKSTIRHAIAMLIADKLIKVTQGRGAEALPITVKPLQYNRYKGYTVTASEFVPEYRDQPFTSTSFFIETVPAGGKAGAALEVPEDMPVYKVQYSQMLGQTPFNYCTVYIPCSLTPDLDAHAAEIIRLYPFIMEHYGITITHTAETLTFGSANLVESRLLAVAINAPLIHSERTVFSGETRLLYSEALLRADLLKLSLVADSPEYII